MALRHYQYSVYGYVVEVAAHHLSFVGFLHDSRRRPLHHHKFQSVSWTVFHQNFVSLYGRQELSIRAWSHDKKALWAAVVHRQIQDSVVAHGIQGTSRVRVHDQFGVDPSTLSNIRRGGHRPCSIVLFEDHRVLRRMGPYWRAVVLFLQTYFWPV
jgi:hypothetical protein